MGSEGPRHAAGTSPAIHEVHVAGALPGARGQRGLWRLLGLNIEAPFEAGPAAPRGAAPDVVVASGGGRRPVFDETGEVIAEMGAPARPIYTVYRLAEGYLQRFHGRCDFVVDEGLSEVRYWTAPGFDDALVPVFFVGTVASLLLTLRGRAVLHGTTVSWRGRTVAFVGGSGKGKTTLAALCCAAGARLVCDDVVPLVHPTEGSGAACCGLGHELRLRPTAREVADLFPAPGPPRRTTADGRLVLRPEVASEEENLLSVLVIPRPSRSSGAVRLRRLGPTEAVTQLLSNSRLPALRPLPLQARYFAVATALATDVPVVEAEVPWGPPFSTSSALEVMALLEALVAEPGAGER